MNPKQKYYSRGGINFVLLDDDGRAVRDATKEEANQAKEQAWEDLWDGFGVGLDDDDESD